MSTLSKPVFNTVFIGLGGNVGNVILSMVQALDGLNKHKEIEVVARSSLYKTPPWGDIDQDDFVNACATLSTSLPPIELLRVLKAEEAKLKRVKTRRWGPRTIDLDILIFENIEFANETLEIPHPRMTDRAFVLQPLAELSGSQVVKGRSFHEWLGLCDQSGIEKIPDQLGWVSGPTG